jgi:hypothetical protein
MAVTPQSKDTVRNPPQAQVWDDSRFLQDGQGVGRTLLAMKVLFAATWSFGQLAVREAWRIWQQEPLGNPIGVCWRRWLPGHPLWS